MDGERVTKNSWPKAGDGAERECVRVSRELISSINHSSAKPTRTDKLITPRVGRISEWLPAGTGLSSGWGVSEEEEEEAAALQRLCAGVHPPRGARTLGGWRAGAHPAALGPQSEYAAGAVDG